MQHIETIDFGPIRNPVLYPFELRAHVVNYLLSTAYSDGRRLPKIPWSDNSYMLLLVA